MWRRQIRRRAAAFTLIELLTVLAVIMVLSVVALPALRGTLDGVNITGAADTVGAELALARQVAMTRNLPVEVRFYKFSASESGMGREAWRAVGALISTNVSGRASQEWIIPGRGLPGGVLMDDSAEYSTLLGLTQADESADAPPLLRNKKYVAFLFNPDGSTDLDLRGTGGGPQPWSLSLRNANAPTSGSAPAANFATIVLDPATGRFSVYQP